MVIFADSGYWIALLFVRDRLHTKAMTMRDTFAPRQVVTSEMVLTEVLNHFGTLGRGSRQVTALFVQSLYDDADVEVVPQTLELFADALELYRNRLDKEWSLTDCASFVICTERGIIEAFAHDKHFAQAGITPLLRDAD